MIFGSDNRSNWDPQGLGLVPMVIEQSGRGERAYDIYFAPAQGARHLPRRPGQRCDRQSCRGAAPVPEAEDPGKDIYFYINSPAARSPRACRSTTRCSSSSPTSHAVHGAGGVDGGVPADGRNQGQAFRAAQLAHHDPPADGGSRARPRISRFHAKEIPPAPS